MPKLVLDTPKTIVLDLDGTVANVMDNILAYVWSRWHVALTPEHCTEYDCAKSFAPHIDDKDGLLAPELQQLWESASFYAGALPYWGIWNLLHHVRKVLPEILFAVCTSRPVGDSVIAATQDWIQTWLPFVSPSVLFASYSKRATGALRKQQALLVEGLPRPVWIFEDDPRTEGVLHTPDGGWHVFYVDRPWNRELLRGRPKRGAEWALNALLFASGVKGAP